MANTKEEQKFEHFVKIIIIGDSAVGKTNILLRFINSSYKMSHVATIGVDFKIKTLCVDGCRIKMQIWDTAGQERFKTMTETYYKGAAGVICAYSVDDKKTFNNIEGWLNQINHSQGDKICKIMVGNKCDVPDSQREVSTKQGEDLAQKCQVSFMESSAKNNINIEQIFKTLAQQIKQKIENEKEQGQNYSNIKISRNQQKKKKGGCCS